MDFKKQVLGKSVQFKELDGEMWVVANDIGRVLGVSRIRDSINSYVDDKNTRTEVVKYINSGQSYRATLINVDGLIQVVQNIRKGTGEQKRAVNNLVIAHMLTMNDELQENIMNEPETLMDLKEDELERLNSYILLEHIYDLRGELEDKDKVIRRLKDKVYMQEEIIYNKENSLSKIEKVIEVRDRRY